MRVGLLRTKINRKLKDCIEVLVGMILPMRFMTILVTMLKIALTRFVSSLLVFQGLFFLLIKTLKSRWGQRFNPVILYILKTQIFMTRSKVINEPLYLRLRMSDQLWLWGYVFLIKSPPDQEIGISSCSVALERGLALITAKWGRFSFKMSFIKRFQPAAEVKSDSCRRNIFQAPVRTSK